MFKRSQQKVSKGSQHWYQDKYQHVLVQRNILAALALVALITAAVSAVAVLRIAPLKSVEPYLLQVNEKTGVTQKVSPITRADYAANIAIDQYFTAMYIRAREGYNFSVLGYNYNIVRLMSVPPVYNVFWRQNSPAVETSIAARMRGLGQREVKINSLNYITNPTLRGQKTEPSSSKIMQARITTTDIIPNQSDVVQQWVVTITFEYANLDLNEADRLLNPLGYVVTSYQIQREIN